MFSAVTSFPMSSASFTSMSSDSLGAIAALLLRSLPDSVALSIASSMKPVSFELSIQSTVLAAFQNAVASFPLIFAFTDGIIVFVLWLQLTSNQLISGFQSILFQQPPMTYTGNSTNSPLGMTLPSTVKLTVSFLFHVETKDPGFKMSLLPANAYSFFQITSQSALKYENLNAETFGRYALNCFSICSDIGDNTLSVILSPYPSVKNAAIGV